MSTDYGVLADFNYQDEQFQGELQAEIVDQLAFAGSGFLAQTAAFNTAGSGHFLNVTQYPTIADTADVILTTVDMNINDFNDYDQRTPWLLRGSGWGIENLVSIIAKIHPIDELIRQASVFVAKTIQASALAELKGIFATALATSHSTGASYSGATIEPTGIFNAKQKIGDAQTKLKIALCNSKVLNDAVLAGIGAFPNSNLGNQLMLTGQYPSLGGMTAWMDDAIAVISSVYSTYFGAPGAAVYAFGGWERRDVMGNTVNASTVDFEFYRNALTSGGEDALLLRFKYLVHPLGMAYNSGTINPTDVQLATGSNWTKVADDNRKIKLVELKTA